MPLSSSLIAAFLVASARAAPGDVDSIVARYVAARGGDAAIAALHSLRLTGKMEMGDPGFVLHAEFGRILARPGWERTEVTLQGLSYVDAWDGRSAWSIDPFEGRRDAQLDSADAARERAREADIGGPLVRWKEKGNRVVLIGTEDVDGTEAVKLRIDLADGDVIYDYLDPVRYLEIRQVTEKHVRGVKEVAETDLSDYGQAGGVWFPFSIASGPKGGRRDERITIERAEVNVPVAPAVFRMPAPGTPASRVVIAAPGAAAAVTVAPPGPASPAVFDAAVLSGLGARNIGSAETSGRVAAVTAFDSGGKTTIYVGAAGGGVWKSEDSGTTFKPVFDREPVQSIGAIAVDPRNPKTVWVGTGESWTRNSVSIGDGIYKSDDGGESWKNVGLRGSERVARIVIDPADGNVVYACVPGKLWSDSADRGVYRTRDGGRSWRKILAGENLSTGCSGLAMDPKDPRVLFAGLWDFRRKGWTFRSGGDGPDAPSGSGLWRSEDGGDHWRELTAASGPGLPPQPWGRVEVAVAPSDSRVVYALIESKDSALYRSGDGGRTWEARDRSALMVWRPFYFGRLVVDPRDPNRVFKPGGTLIVSEDGGKSFAQTGGGSHGDWHDLWIDPENGKHVVGGDDGGLWTSWDGGSRWWKMGNLPISQFYHVAIDGRDPYHVYGGLQDNASFTAPSDYPGGITDERWEELGEGCDGFWAVPDPTDPDAVYVECQGGYLSRLDRRTYLARDIQPKARAGEKLRFNWNAPIATSPTNPRTLYLGAQLLFRSRDRGAHWDRLSPDLTTNDPQKQKQEESGGVTVDNSAAEMHTTIFAIAESPRDARTIWAGTDDGNLQITRDGGKHWTNVAGNVPGLPRFSWVSWVEPSRADPEVAYATFDRHTFGDMDPYVYRTGDDGRSWTRLAGPGQGVRGWAHVIREDPVDRDILYLGTELGLWISIDRGESWARFTGAAFPSVAVTDLAVQPRDGALVIATHGRGIWIIDDVSPLRRITADLLARPIAFVPGPPAQQRLHETGGWVEGDASFTGENPPAGAVVTYYLRDRHLFGPLSLDVLDGAGKVVATPPPTGRRGLNRVAWTMQLSPPRVPKAASVAWAGSQGPRVLPGKYTIRLTEGGRVVEEPFVVTLDRRSPWSLADRKANLDASLRVVALFDRMTDLAGRIEAARKADEARAKALPGGDPLVARLRGHAAGLEALERKIVATKVGGAITGEERIREHADHLYEALLGWEGRPADYLIARIGALDRELSEVETAFEKLGTKQASLDGELRRRGVASRPAEERPELAAVIRCFRSDGLACGEVGERATDAR